MLERQSKNGTWIGLALIALSLYLIPVAALAAPPKGDTLWHTVKLPYDESITGLAFPTPQIGYLVTSGGKYGKTVNAGKDWDVYILNEGAVFEDVSFRNKDTGLIVGRWGYIYRTIDAGKMWENRRLKDTVPWVTSGVFLTDSVAVFTTILPGTGLQGKLFRTTSSCIRIDSIPFTGKGPGELFYKPGLPVCFQSYGKLNYSTDKGATWKSLQTLTGKPGRATSFYNNTGIICGSSAMCGYSNDRGKTWTAVQLEGGADLTTAVMVDDSLGYVGGTGGIILVTKNGGKKWEKDLPLPFAVDIAKLEVAGDKLFVAGAGGFIFYKYLPTAHR